ncbi:MAG TPA: fatty acid--CoA ligase family protein [Candidatus Binatia bacterium]|nr:fatty acid--CoA ligase family protein [Candidatus Binatia bacterium]
MTPRPRAGARERRSARSHDIVDLIARHARHADRVALVDGEERVTYAELLDLVERSAGALAAAGALAGRDGPARVGLACPNGVAHVALALGVLRGGGCVVPIASELSAPERLALVQSVDLDAIVVAEGATLAGVDRTVRAAALDLPGWSASALVDPLGRRRSRPAFDAEALARVRPALIRLSSGTTGASKGVVIGHAALARRVDAANRALEIAPGDRILWVLPMAHHFAVSVVLYLVAGAATVLVESHLAEDMLSAAHRHEATVLYAAPFHHALLASEPSGRPWDALRLAISTTASLPAATARAFADRFGRPLSQALGIIEVGLPAINLERAHDKPESVGRALPDFAIEVRDGAGTPAAPGAVGELFVRGPGMLDAYLAPWRPRDEILQDGWFATGDLAEIDADGDLRLVGRARSVINVAGMKCFPEEIEAVLLEHPGVSAARVSARPHPRVGSVPVAEVVAADPTRPPRESALAAHCRAALARFKVPVEFRLVAALPVTASGKVRRATPSRSAHA